MAKIQNAKCKRCKNVFQYAGWSMPKYCSNCVNDMNAEKRHKELLNVEKERVHHEQSFSVPTSTTTNNSGKKFHGLYFVLVGWAIGMIMVSFIIPLLTPKGREFTAKCFGYW